MKSKLYITVLLLFLVILFASCIKQNIPYNADSIFTESEQKEWVYQVIRYAGHLAPRATHDTKFSSEFDAHYRELAEKHKLNFIYSYPESGEQYFLITRQAPSLYDRRVAIAGMLLLDENGELVHYEEKFRTWKLSPDELMEKSKILFSKLVAGEDLSPFYPENSGDEEYIEFPDQYTSFDVDKREWVTTRYSITSETSSSN
ncbi:MAG: hypothetical protein JJU37_14055 [Balneolaceae bacterium]|nr:hypothetical protein [Balneolaceae bacterium]